MYMIYIDIDIYTAWRTCSRERRTAVFARRARPRCGPAPVYLGEVYFGEVYFGEDHDGDSAKEDGEGEPAARRDGAAEEDDGEDGRGEELQLVRHLGWRDTMNTQTLEDNRHRDTATPGYPDGRSVMRR